MMEKMVSSKVNDAEHNQFFKINVLHKKEEKRQQQVITKKHEKLQKQPLVALGLMLFLVCATPALSITEPFTVKAYKHHYHSPTKQTTYHSPATYHYHSPTKQTTYHSPAKNKSNPLLGIVGQGVCTLVGWAILKVPVLPGAICSGLAYVLRHH